MPTIVHFDVPAEDTQRAKAFYASLFDWKFQAFPEMEYNLITTTNLDGSPGVGGGLGKRMEPSQRMMNYFGAPSFDASMKQVRSLGGKGPHGEDGRPRDGLPCQLHGHRGELLRALGGDYGGKVTRAEGMPALPV